MKPIARWAALFLCLPVFGCVTTATMTYTSTLSKAEARAARSARGGDVQSHFAKDFAKEVAEMFGNGYELMGYSRFVAPLQPSFAEWNAGTAAKKNGASIALLAPPEPASLNQYHYTFTFWRPAADKPRLFGAFYGDTDPQILGVGGCGLNVVRLSVVAKGSPAEKAGLRRGDAVASVDDEPVVAARSLDDFSSSMPGSGGDPVYSR